MIPSLQEWFLTFENLVEIEKWRKNDIEELYFKFDLFYLFCLKQLNVIWI